MKAIVEPSFWKDKKVFITGHTGFKGSWLSLWLCHMGASVKGYALEPATDPSLFYTAHVHEGILSEIGDIRDAEGLKRSIMDFNPDILIHMAAQPLVRYSYRHPVETYQTNVMGTVNVLEAARDCDSLRALINVTTDKCYENREWDWGYRENEAMGGFDPYSSSKGCSELVTSAYRRSFFSTPGATGIASARAGNVIGGGDWAEDRLIPDVLEAFEAGKPVLLRNPTATRPWQHVLEPLSGYLVLAQALYHHQGKFSGAWNFGPADADCCEVESVIRKLADSWGLGASWQTAEETGPHEAGLLKLDTSKARRQLNWTPTWNLSQTVKKIVLWHKEFLQGTPPQSLCISQIDSYLEDMGSSAN